MICDVCGRESADTYVSPPAGMCSLRWPSSEMEHWRLGYERLRASLTTAEKTLAKREREIHLITAEHDKAWVLLGKENDKARAAKESESRTASAMEKALKERDEARAALDGVTEAADKITLANVSIAIQLRATESALEKALGALREAHGPQTIPAAPPREE